MNNAVAQNSSDSDPLNLQNPLSRNQVIIIGWVHIEANQIIPNEIQKALGIVKPQTPRLLLESPADKELIISDRKEGGKAMIRLAVTVSNLGGELVSADHPKSDLEEAYVKIAEEFNQDPSLTLLEKLTLFIEKANKIAVPMEKRDRHFAETIKSASKKSGPVILLVGEAHVGGIIRELKTMGITPEVRQTSTSFSFREVRWGKRLVGYLDDTREVRILRALEQSIKRSIFDRALDRIFDIGYSLLKSPVTLIQCLTERLRELK